jgi:hypothetical protein
MLYWPLSTLAEQSAKEVHTWLQLAATVVIIAAATAWARRRLDLLLFVLAVTSFSPFYITLANGQPAAFLALIVTFALVALTKGAIILSGALTGLLVLKPHFLPLPLLMLARHGREPAFRKASLVAVLVAAAVFFVPFVWLGLDALRDYLAMLLDRLRIDDRSAGHDPRLMTNWIGFWTNVLRSEPPASLVLLCSGLSVALAVRIFIAGTLREAWFAAVAATLIAGPHILPYDWMIILPVTFALVSEARSWVLVALLALVHTGLGLHGYLEDILGPLTARGYELTTHVAVPLLFVVLVYLAWPRRTQSAPEGVSREVGVGASVRV